MLPRLQPTLLLAALLAALLAVLVGACQSRRLGTSHISGEASPIRPTRSCQETLGRPQGFPFSTLEQGPESTAFQEMALYYGCASQEYNFEQGFRSSSITFKSFHSEAMQHMRGLFDFPFWDTDFSLHQNVKTNSWGERAFCADPLQNSCTTKRIMANPHDTIHVRVLSEAFGEPTGTLPAIMTSSWRTVLVLPPGRAAYFLKMPGQTLLASPLKALKPEEVMESLYYSSTLSPKVPSLYPETAGLLLQASFLLPDMANFVDLDRDVYFERYPEDRHPRRYTLLRREFPDLRRLVQPAAKTLLMPGHSLLSRAFLESELGKKIAGTTEEQRFEWARRWIWPTVSDFIVSSIVDHGIHFEAHFQNMDFLLALDDADQVQDIAVLMKDLGDIIADPVVQIVQGQQLSEPVLAAGPWAEQNPSFKEAVLEQKYGGKFGMLEPSVVFGRDIQHPEWAISLRRSLAESFGKLTAKRGIPSAVLSKEKNSTSLFMRSKSQTCCHSLNLARVLQT